MSTTSSSPVRGWSAARRWYTSLAVYACNVILLLVLLNVLLAGVFAVHDEHGRRQLPATLRAMKQRHGPSVVSLAHPGWDEEAVIRLYDEWSQVTHEYDPFTQFKLRPMRGVYIKISEHGFRLNGHPAPWPPDTTAFNIFVFGGSTTFGAGLPDDQTIPAALEAHLRRACTPLTRVYNFGRPGYLSVQERALFEQLVLSGAVARVAVFVDGLNDSVWPDASPPQTQSLKRVMDLVQSRSALRRASSWARELVSSLPMTRAAWLLRHPVSRNDRPDRAAASASPSADVPVEDRLRQWVVNKRLIEGAARQFGIRTLFVWQPIPSYGYDLAYHLSADASMNLPFPDPTVPERTRRAYDLMAMRRGDAEVEPNFLWLADIQRGRRENLYVDTVHYTAAFSREIARGISDDMARRGWLPCGLRTAG